MTNKMLNKTMCPSCNGKMMEGFRQGAFNPNPVSRMTGKRICMECYIDEQYASRGVDG